MCTCCCPIPPKYAVAQVVGFIEGKSAFGEWKRNFVGQHFWASESTSSTKTKTGELVNFA